MKFSYFLDPRDLVGRATFSFDSKSQKFVANSLVGAAKFKVKNDENLLEEFKNLISEAEEISAYPDAFMFWETGE